jgi:hypothetical protein
MVHYGPTCLNLVSSPPVKDLGENKIIGYTGSKKNSVIASICPVRNSKWLIAVELSRKKVLETANRFLYWLIITGCVLLIIGFFIAWLTSQNISKPCKKSDDGQFITCSLATTLLFLIFNRRDELGRLAERVPCNGHTRYKHSREELEKKAQNYKLLFERNPMPMWIIAEETLEVMDVNDAAG